MTLEILFFFALLAGLVALFVNERVAPDLAAMSVLVVLVFTGYLTPADAFSGFASSASVTLIAMFIIGAGLNYTGIADIVAERIYRFGGSDEKRTIICVMFLCCLVSSFMNNVAATALLLPAVATIARRSSVPLSRLLIPLSFASLLGGAVTLIGTAPNIVASQILVSSGYRALGFFSYSGVATILLLGGIVYMVLFGRQFLPRNKSTTESIQDEDLTKLYRLYERIFSVRVPVHSKLVGQSLCDLHFGESLDLGIVSIERKGSRVLAPGPAERLQAGDNLIVRGRFNEFENLHKLRGVQIAPFEERGTEMSAAALHTVAFVVPAGLAGKTLRQLRVQDQFGFLVVSINRGDEQIFEDLGSEPLQQGDLLHSVGAVGSIHELSSLLGLEPLKISGASEKRARGTLFTMRIPQGSALSDESVRSARLGELTGFTVVALLRGEETLFPIPVEHHLREGDLLVVAGDAEKARSLAKLGELEITAAESASAELESDQVGMVEVVIAPRSNLIGKTLEQIRFRERYDLQVLAIWKQGQPLRARLARTPLEFGDALLVQGSRDRFSMFTQNPDFVALTEAASRVKRRDKAHFAVGAVLLLLAIELLRIQSVEVAAWTAAIVLVLGGAVTMEEAYREIDWRIVILVSALLPLGIAFERTGAAALVVAFLSQSVGTLGPLGVLAGLTLMSTAISQLIDGSLAVVLIAPIAILLAEKMGLPPYPFVIATALSASNAFLTPFSHRSHLLVMGLGGYRIGDYFRVGAILTVLYYVTLIMLVYLTFGFYR